jgi:hypothetical protein
LEANLLPVTWGKKVKNQNNYGWEQSPDSPARNLMDSGAIRAALLFGSAAVAFALILAPIFDRGADNFGAKRAISSGLDGTSTGSIHQKRGYTVRRSILQGGPSSVCIIADDGSQTGRC